MYGPAAGCDVEIGDVWLVVQRQCCERQIGGSLRSGESVIEIDFEANDVEVTICWRRTSVYKEDRFVSQRLKSVATNLSPLETYWIEKLAQSPSEVLIPSARLSCHRSSRFNTFYGTTAACLQIRVLLRRERE